MPRVFGGAGYHVANIGLAFNLITTYFVKSWIRSLDVLSHFSSAKDIFTHVVEQCENLLKHSSQRHSPAAPEAHSGSTRSPVSIESNSYRLLVIATRMIAKFPGINKPVNLIWAGDSEEWADYIKRYQDYHHRSESNRASLSGNWIGLMCDLGDEYWILIRGDYMAYANDSQVRGLLSHELAHAEIASIASSGLINRERSYSAYRWNERLTDLFAISKGFGPDLLNSRAYSESMTGGRFPDTSMYMSSSVIAMFLARSRSSRVRPHMSHRTRN